MKKFILVLLIFIAAGVIFAGYRLVNSIGEDPEPDYLKLQQHSQENIGATGEYQTGDFDPTKYLTTWNFNNLPPDGRAEYYKETLMSDGSLLREYKFYIVDKEIEVAPGVFYPAWTYNGQVPGPTIRATEGDTIKIRLVNGGTKPHSAHFHGFHSAEMDGSAFEDMVLPGETFEYQFKAGPFGTHIYHCHSYPVSQHISRGLYGAYIVDPKNDTRPKADKELVMVMNGFDVNFDGKNEIYAVNTRSFAYDKNPIMVKKGELVRVYLANMLEFDPVNSFHLHANFFDQYKTGTNLTPDSFTDTIIMGQAERSVLDVRFREPGMYMFHSHVTEFSELGWTGMFMVME